MCHKRSGVAAFKLHEFSNAKEAFQKAAQLASLNNRLDASYLEWIRQCDEKLSPPAEQKQPAATAPSKSPPFTESTKEKISVSTASKDSKGAAATSATKPPGNTTKRPTSAPRYQYYQSDKVMTISILEASVKEEDRKSTRLNSVTSRSRMPSSA